MQALFEHTCELASKARNLIMVLLLTSTVSEGDVPHHRIVVRNVIRSGFGASLAAVLLVASPFEFGREPTAVTALNLRSYIESVADPCATRGSCATLAETESVADPCTTKDSCATLTETNSRKCHINGPAETKSVAEPSLTVKGSCVTLAETKTKSVAEPSLFVKGSCATLTETNSREYHINGLAEFAKSVDDPFVFERGSTVAFEEFAMQKLQNLLLIFLFLLKDPQLHLTNISTHYTHLGLTHARVGDTSRGNQNIQDIKCEFKDTIVLTCVGDRIILSRDKFMVEKLLRCQNCAQKI